jgi:hypothetical protein
MSDEGNGDEPRGWWGQPIDPRPWEQRYSPAPQTKWDLRTSEWRLVLIAVIGNLATAGALGAAYVVGRAVSLVTILIVAIACFAVLGVLTHQQVEWYWKPHPERRERVQLIVNGLSLVVIICVLALIGKAIAATG